MPWFTYKVTDKTGNNLTGAMSASSEESVKQRLIDGGYTIIGVTAEGISSKQQTQPSAIMQTFKTSPPSKDMAVFFTQLSISLKGGLNIFDALSQIGMHTENSGLKLIIQRMASVVENGANLSNAMAEFPRAFPPHVIGVVASGELGGFLPMVVGDIALDYEIANRASSRIARFWSSFIWTHIIAFILFMPIVPLMIKGTKDLQVNTSTTDISANLMLIFRPFLLFTITYSIPGLLLILGLYYGIRYWIHLPENRHLLSKMTLRIPWAGKASRERSIASFSRILWRLLSAGVLPIQAWEAASKAPENTYIAQVLDEQSGLIRSGKSFSETLAASGFFNTDDQRVLQLAEKSGAVPDALQRMATYYEDSAMISAGRAKWLGTRIGIILLLLSMGGFIIMTASSYADFLTTFLP